MVELATSAKNLKRNRSDYELETGSDHFGSVVNLADLAIRYSKFAGMCDDVELGGDTSVSMAVLCASPRLLRACRAANAIAGTIKENGLPGLEPAVQRINQNAQYLRGLEKSNLTDPMKESSSAILVKCEQVCSDAVAAWMDSQLTAVRDAANALMKASQSEAVAAAHTAVLKPKVSDEDLELVSSDAVASLHECMKALRALDSAVAVQPLKALANKFPFLPAAKISEFHAEVMKVLRPDNKGLCMGGKILADLTVSQAMHRTLDPGETRTDLVKRVSKGVFKRQWHSVSAPIQAKIDALVGVSGQV